MPRIKKQTNILPDIYQIFIKDDPNPFTTIQIKNNFLTATNSKILLTIDLEQLDINIFKNKEIYIPINQLPKIAFAKILNIDETTKQIICKNETKNETPETISKIDFLTTNQNSFPNTNPVSDIFYNAKPTNEPVCINIKYIQSLYNTFKRIENIQFLFYTVTLNSNYNFNKKALTAYITKNISSEYKLLAKAIIMPLNLTTPTINRFDQENFFPSNNPTQQTDQKNQLQETQPQEIQPQET